MAAKIHDDSSYLLVDRIPRVSITKLVRDFEN